MGKRHERLIGGYLNQVKAAFPGWKAKPIEERQALIRKCGEALMAETEGLARLFTREQGRPPSAAELAAAAAEEPASVADAAALVADELAPGARAWWQAGHRSTEPAHTLALDHLGLTPIVDLGMRLGEGTGAAVALPVVRAAVATLASMATFGEAGVSS